MAGLTVLFEFETRTPWNVTGGRARERITCKLSRGPSSWHLPALAVSHGRGLRESVAARGR